MPAPAVAFAGKFLGAKAPRPPTFLGAIAPRPCFGIVSSYFQKYVLHTPVVRSRINDLWRFTSGAVCPPRAPPECFSWFYFGFILFLPCSRVLENLARLPHSLASAGFARRCWRNTRPPKKEGSKSPLLFIVDYNIFIFSVVLAGVAPNTVLIETAITLIDTFRALILRCYVVFSHSHETVSNS